MSLEAMGAAEPEREGKREPGTRFGRARTRHLKIGRRGERLACRLLRELGLIVLVRNYRGREGEVDIVAREGEILCFVEVKTRRRMGRSRPAEAVGRAKRRHIRRTAYQYLRELGHPAVVYRYDIVEILLAEGRRLDAAYYWPGAFAEEERSDGLRFPALVRGAAAGDPQGRGRSHV